MTETLNTEQMAALLDLSPQRLRELARRGAVPKSGHGRFVPADVVPAYCRALREQAAGRSGERGALDLIDERAKLARAQTVRAEIDIAERRRELVPAEEVRRFGRALGSTVVHGLYSIPDRLADEVAGMERPHEIHALMLREIDHVVSNLRTLIAQGVDSHDPNTTNEPKSRRSDEPVRKPARPSSSARHARGGSDDPSKL